MFVQSISYNQPKVTVATIAASASLSAAVALPIGHVLVAIVMPSAWDAAGITLQGSFDGTTYQNVYIAAGTELALTVAAATNVALDPLLYQAFPFLKIRSGTAGAPVNQTASRAITLITRPI